MKVLFFYKNDTAPYLFTKIQADLLTSHVLEGDNIYIVKDFNKDIAKTHISYDNNYYLYRNKKVFNNLINHLKKLGGKINLLDYKKSKNFNPQIFSNVEDLKNYTIDGYCIGMGVASTLISLFRDHKLDTIKNKKNIERELKISLNVLTTIEAYAKEISPDIVYVLNGRNSFSAPVVLYCKKNNITFRVFDITYLHSTYHLIENNTPHHLENRRKEINDTWEKSSISHDKKIKIGYSFFENQRKGINETDPSYIGLQNKEIDHELIKEKEVISFFNSSIDEFAAVPGWEDYLHIFNDEVEAIETICNHYKNDQSKIFILRIHPNLKYLNNTQNRELEKLKQLKNLIIIAPESPIRSYSLLDKSDKIITFGSTIGIEACYYGKPVISLGLSFYEHLDVAYVPKNKEELFSYIECKNLIPKPKENTIIYGYYAKTFGKPFTNFINGAISTEDYELTKGQKIVTGILKFSNLLYWKNLKKIFKIFNPKNRIFIKLKDPSYRKKLLRTFTPWK
jgi:hypothetical protein